MTVEPAARPRSDLTPIALLVLLGVAARTLLALTTPLIGTDAALFVWNAELWGAEGWKAAVRFPKHPLYPFLLWLLGGTRGGYERAGLVISILFGALQVVPVFLLTRRLAGRGAAIAAGVLLAIHPHSCRLSGDVMTEGMYYLLLLSALWFGYVAGADRRWGAALLAGLLSGLAYLARPEGAAFAGLAGVWIVLAGLRAWRGMLLRGALLTLAFAATILPYLVAVHAVTGQWLLTKKGAQIEWDSYALPHSEVPLPEGRELSRFEKYVEKYGPYVAYARHFARELPTVYKLYLLPLVIGLVIACRRGVSDRPLNIVLALVWVAWLALFVWVLHKYRYLSSRHLLTLFLVSMPWMGLGARALLAWLVEFFPGHGRTVAVVLSLAFVAGTLVETFKPQRRDQLGERMAGEWIRDHGGGPGVTVLAISEKPAYYSNGRLLWWPPGPYAFLREKALPRARFLAATEKEALTQTPDLPLGGVPGELERVWQSPPFGDEGPVVVWEVVRRP